MIDSVKEKSGNLSGFSKIKKSVKKFKTFSDIIQSQSKKTKLNQEMNGEKAVDLGNMNNSNTKGMSKYRSLKNLQTEKTQQLKIIGLGKKFSEGIQGGSNVKKKVVQVKKLKSQLI